MSNRTIFRKWARSRSASALSASAPSRRPSSYSAAPTRRSTTPRATAATWPATTTSWSPAAYCKPWNRTTPPNSSDGEKKPARGRLGRPASGQRQEAHRINVPLRRRLVADDLVAAAKAQAARQIHRLRLDVQVLLGIEEHIDLGCQQIAFVGFDHHAEPSRLQHHHRTDRIDADAAHEFL